MIDTNVMKERFLKMGEFYAAGFFEETDKSSFVRHSRALRRYFENYNLMPYNNEPLYPCGKISQGLLVFPHYSYTIIADLPSLSLKDKEVAHALEKQLGDTFSVVPHEHTIGGSMYTHSHPNFRRLVREGLDSYEERIKKITDDDIRIGLLDVVEGVRTFHCRILDMLKTKAEDSELYKALQRVPFGPAKTLYEALVSWNFIYYLDGCDNIGHLDADLIDFYNGEDMTDVFRCMFKNVDVNDGWTGAVGPHYNPLTLQCIKAVKGMRRPSLELRVTKDMPQEIWEAAMESIYAGGGSPSLYNEEAYQNALKELFPEIPKEDRMRFAGGGCTETMLAGISNVGSLDAGVNVALIFEQVMQDYLPTAKSFDEFYDLFIKESHRQINEVMDAISQSQKNREERFPQPMRTLLVDDCIEKGKDFNSGGARYYWSVVNLAGIINVIDSLSVINHLVYQEKTMGGEEFLRRLNNNENFSLYRKIAKHGTDDSEVNALAYRVSKDICSAFDNKRPCLGGRFLPSSIQFVTYGWAGEPVGATPDGRTKGAPLCDSIGAIHGNDTKGITALLNSAAALCQSKMAGTPVLNIKLDANKVSGNLKALVNGYFANGGMQIQVTCIDKEELLKAKENPENYPNLIVRIGGYSEYFNRLSSDLQQTVVDRMLHEL